MTQTVGYELTVVVPTFNEGANVEELLRRLDGVLARVAWQAIFVDDNSPDGTAEVVKRIAARDPRVLCLHRVNRRGLAGAVIEGALASAAPFVAVMDGDLQHDEALLPAMLQALREDRADLVVGSRYVGGQAEVTALNPIRRAGSRLAAWLGRRALKVEMGDPVSGFFMIRRALVDEVAPRLSPDGFKILFDIVASLRKPPRILELPYEFRERQVGVSKLDNRVVVEYLSLVAAKLSHNLVSPRFLMFALVGASGVGVNLGVLWVLRHVGVAFWLAQFLAAITAMTSNYLINNAVTYRDRRKRGLALIGGYLRFCVVCSIPIFANVAVASMVNEHGAVWWVSGLAGAVVAAMWNYVVSSRAVW